MNVYKWIKVKGVKYGLVTEEKVRRTQDRNDSSSPIANGDDPSKDEIVLAYYDKFGGLIVNSKGKPVKNGTFWDSIKSAPKV